MRENSVGMKQVLQMDGHHIVLVTPDDADWLVFYSEWMEGGKRVPKKEKKIYNEEHLSEEHFTPEENSE